MTPNKIIIFTDRFPYGSSEPFFSAELTYLSKAFQEIIIFPLDAAGNLNSLREIPSNVIIIKPVFFNYKSIVEILTKGVFNRSIIWPFMQEFFIKKCWASFIKFKNWCTYTLVTRALISSWTKFKMFNYKDENLVLYFYWGLRWSQVLPFISDNKCNELKTIVRFHGSDLYEEVNHEFIPHRNEMIQRISTAVFISESGRHYFKNKYSFFKGNHLVARLGTYDFGINPIINKDEIHIVSCSNLVPLKRVHLIAECLSFLSDKFHWTHIGDGSEMGEIKRILNHNNSLYRCKFFGSKHHSSIMEFYQKEIIHVFINVSSSEGVPVSIMEALSFGIPVIATDVGGTCEIVDNMVGLLVSKDITGKELATYIQEVTNHSQYHLFRKQARLRWEERCNAQKVYTKFIQDLKEIIE